MRKIGALAAVCLLLLTLGVTAHADTNASNLSATANVNANGSCMVNLSLTVHLDAPVKNMYFPVPLSASGVRLNGSRVFFPGKEGDAQLINLSRYTRNSTGDISFNIQYDLYGLVKETDIETLQLELPLLSGFDYPVQNLSFTVNLPGETQALPAFTSGYHQSSIEQFLTFSADGSVIQGSSVKALNDRETLVMTLPVSEDIFGRVVVGTQSTLAAQIGMGLCALLAVLYWLLTLRAFPWGKRCTQMPDGFNAGQMGCILGSGGVDLSMTVLSWAQLGYILLQPDRRGRVVLHKRMDMGNERSDFERRVFQKLFGTRHSVDASSMHYANLRLSLAGKPAGVQELLHRRTGKAVIFRILASGVGLFAGGGIGFLLGTGGALQWVLAVLWAILGSISAWLILPWTDSGLLRNTGSMLLGGGLCAGWILLSLAAGNIALGLWMAAGLLLAGILYGWAGRRTELGRQTRSQVLGLRRYLQGSDKEQLRRACSMDPDYYFAMAPYAIALGVGKSFAAGMGQEKLSRCSYLAGSPDSAMRAAGWNRVLEHVVKDMDARSRRLPLEKLLRILNNLTKP